MTIDSRNEDPKCVSMTWRATHAWPCLWDISLLDDDGEPQKIEVIDGYQMSLPPGVYIEIESTPVGRSG